METFNEHGISSKLQENLDDLYESYLKVVEKRNRILPRTYHIDSAYT